jgi:hypothetical protein
MKLFGIEKFTQLFRKDYTDDFEARAYGTLRIASHLRNDFAKKIVCIMRDDGFRDKVGRK